MNFVIEWGKLIMRNNDLNNILVGLITDLLFYILVESFKWLYGIEKITLEISGQILSVILLVIIFLCIILTYFYNVRNKA